LSDPKNVDPVAAAPKPPTQAEFCAWCWAVYDVLSSSHRALPPPPFDRPSGEPADPNDEDIGG